MSAPTRPHSRMRTTWPMTTVWHPRSALLAVALAAALAGCANLAPPAQRPAPAIPAQWPGQPAGQSATPSPDEARLGAADATLPDWRTVLQSPRLRALVALSLDQNRSLRQAVLAIEQARAVYQIQQASQTPTLKATASNSLARTPAQASSSGVASTGHSYSVGLGVAAFELDLFGRVANLKDAALESYLATEQARRSTQIALVAEVAQAWLQLAADQALRQLAQDTLASQQRSLVLVQQRHALGADSGLTLAQTETTVAAARRDLAAYEAQVQQDLNALQLLAGASVPQHMLPEPPASAELAGAAALVAVPAGLPSSLLQQRPDVRAAEHRLAAAQADIGAARAARYPSISLTGSAGTASRRLGELFKGGAWSFVPSISLPIFDGGVGQAGVAQAQASRDIALAGYDLALQTAFREVADALAVQATLQQRLSAQAELVAASRRAFDLAQARRRAGAATALDELDAQRSLYASQQALINLQLVAQGNRVTLFKVLGGGWSAPGAAS